LAENIISHSHGGSVTINYQESEDNTVIEIMSRNDGNALPPHAFKDGFSTGNSLGIGLGAVKRFSNKLVSERRGNTNIIRSFLCKNPAPFVLHVGMISHALLGINSENGDNCIMVSAGNRDLFCVVDALGHGNEACQSAEESVKYIENNSHFSLDNLIYGIHNGLRGKRGASLSLVSLDYHAREFVSSGVGDVIAKIYYPLEERPFYPLAQDGVVGENVRKISITKSPLTRDTIVVMYSDGLSRMLDVPLFRRYDDFHEMLCSTWEDYYKKSDDATLLIAQVK
jgi:hypothetical protein